MNIIKDGKIVSIENNPAHCNNLTQRCSSFCDNLNQLSRHEKDRCQYHRLVKDINQTHTVINTDYEIKFIDGLGTFSGKGRFSTKKTLLKNYLEFNNIKKKFGKVNRLKVDAYATNLLSKC